MASAPVTWSAVGRTLPRGRGPRAALVVLVLSVAFTACGGTDERGTAATPSAASTSTVGDAPTQVTEAATCQQQEDLPLSDDQHFREVGSEGRSYQLYLPATYRADRPAPLVLDLHGAGGDAAVQEGFSGFEGLAERAGFLLVRPQALIAGLWSLYEMADVEYVAAVIADVRTVACIDADRIYVAGMSQGGHLATYLACRSPGVFAAVASVAVLDHPVDCDPGPTHLVAFIGRGDLIYRIDTGLDEGVFEQATIGDPPADARPGPLREEAAAWASTNGCRPQPKIREIGKRVDLWSYRCREADLEIYIHGGGHAWPGSLEGLDASDLIWAFFEEHERAAAGT